MCKSAVGACTVCLLFILCELVWSDSQSLVCSTVSSYTPPTNTLKHTVLCVNRPLGVHEAPFSACGSPQTGVTQWQMAWPPGPQRSAVQCMGREPPDSKKLGNTHMATCMGGWSLSALTDIVRGEDTHANVLLHQVSVLTNTGKQG